MSRIGRKPVDVVKGVTVEIQGNRVTVKGPKGTMKAEIPAVIELAQKEGKVFVTRKEETRKGRSLHGSIQSLVHNMVLGVTTGFVKELEIQGVGFRAEMKGKDLQLSLGFSHPVLFPIPEGIHVKVANQTGLTIDGCDKVLVGQIAANIRELKPPEPYQGKGIRYKGEVVRKKVGKAAAGATGA